MVLKFNVFEYVNHDQTNMNTMSICDFYFKKKEKCKIKGKFKILHTLDLVKTVWISIF